MEGPRPKLRLVVLPARPKERPTVDRTLTVVPSEDTYTYIVARRIGRALSDGFALLRASA